MSTRGFAVGRNAPGSVSANFAESSRFPAVCHLARHIGEPGSVWAAQGLAPLDYFAQLVASPERAGHFTRMLYELHLPLADELAQALDRSGVARMLDLGGGPVVVSLALLRRYAHLTAVVVDIAEVCAAWREIAAEHAAADRITYHAADFVHEELPGAFDLVLECDVGIYDEALFGRIRAALRPGARLVIVDQFAPAPGIAPPSRLHWAFPGSLENPNSAFPTLVQVRTELTRAGFRLLSEELLPLAAMYFSKRGYPELNAVPNEDIQRFLNRERTYRNSDYVETLRIWEGLYSSSQVFVGFFEQLEQEPARLLKDVYEFLGVDSFDKYVPPRCDKRFTRAAKGVLRLPRPLNFPEHTQLMISVWKLEAAEQVAPPPLRTCTQPVPNLSPCLNR